MRALRVVISAGALALLLSEAGSAESGGKEEAGAARPPAPVRPRAEVPVSRTLFDQAAPTRSLAALGNEDTLQALEEQVAALQSLLADLQKERQSELAYRAELQAYIAQLQSHIAGLQQAIQDVQGELDGLPMWTAPMNPVVIAQRDSLESDRDRLREQFAQAQAELAHSEAEREKTIQRIARLEALIEEAQQRIAETRRRVVELRRRLEVAIVAPTEGRRVQVGDTVELDLRSEVPPERVRIEIEKAEDVQWGSVGDVALPVGTPYPSRWRRIYGQTRDWKSLSSASSTQARLSLATRAVTEDQVVAVAGGRTMAPSLTPGFYRARAQRGGGEIASPWRTFWVVGTLGQEALRKVPIGMTPDVGAPEGTRARPEAAPPTLPAGGAGTPARKRIAPSVLKRRELP